MEVYSPATDNAYEYRSDVTGTVVNKRRNYHNLQRSIQAHKNRLAMARLKKGKNLPGDELAKHDNSAYCRQSTADTNENYEPYRFRRHTQSSLNKITRPVLKYNSLSSSNSSEGRYENEKLYIKKYDDFGGKVNDAVAKYDSNLAPKYSNNSEFSFEPQFQVNKGEPEELEKKVLEILRKLLLKQEVKHHSQALGQEPTKWAQKQDQNSMLKEQVNTEAGNQDPVVDILTKCISTTLNTASNECCDNFSSARTSKSVNVEINLNMPQPKAAEPSFIMNVKNSVEEVGDVYIENVFKRDTKIVQENIFKRAYDKVKCIYLPEKNTNFNRNSKRSSTASVNQNYNTTRLIQNHEDVVYKTKKAHAEWVQSQSRISSMNRIVPSSTQWNQAFWKKAEVITKANPGGWAENKQRKGVKSAQSARNEQTNIKATSNLNQPGRKNSFSGFISGFRPFSRSRSQSVHLEARKSQSYPEIPRNNNLVQPARSFTSNNNSVQAQNLNLKGDFGNQWNNPPKQNNFNYRQSQDVRVDDSFDPFNLKQRFGVKNGNSWTNEKKLSTWVEKPAANPQNNNFNKVPMVKRNNSFNFFRRNSGFKRGNQEFLSSYKANFTDRFERNGVNCVDPFGNPRQPSFAKLLRTHNINKLSNEHKQSNQQIPQSTRLIRQPQTPSVFTKVKRINTDPRMFNRVQPSGNSFGNHKHYTDDVNLKLSQTNTKFKLLKSQSVINTLNSLSRLNTMY